MDPATLTAIQQLGTAGAIVLAVVYLQRSTAGNLRELVKLVLPALDSKAELAALSGKVDAVATKCSDMEERLARIESHQAHTPAAE
jgi:hypothetical protein